MTICTHDRQCVFGEIVNDTMRLNDIGKIVHEEWTKTPIIRPEIELDGFVLMPNHVHGIIIINEMPNAKRDGLSQKPKGDGTSPLRNTGLGRVIASFKYQSTKRINESMGTPGKKVFQRGYYDHIIRNDPDLHRIRAYIANNPMQWAIDEENPENQE